MCDNLGVTKRRMIRFRVKEPWKKLAEVEGDVPDTEIGRLIASAPTSTAYAHDRTAKRPIKIMHGICRNCVHPHARKE